MSKFARSQFSVAVGVICLATPFTVAPRAAAQPSPPRARIVEDLRLDAKNEDFPAVSALSVGPHHQIAVLIQGDAQIRLYDSTGKRIGAVGRKGSGPGEFRYLGPQSWKADTLIVDDGQQRRFTLISPDAKVLRTVPYPTLKSVQVGPRRISALNTQNQRALATTSDGSHVAYWNEPVAKPTPMQRAMGGPLHVLVLNPDGNARTIFIDSDYSDERWAMEAFGFGDFVPFTYVPTTVASNTGDRLAHMSSIATSRDGGTFTVSLFRPTGDKTVLRTFPFRGVPIPRPARDSAIAEYTKGFSEGGAATGKRFQEQAQQKMPPTYPGVQSILLGLDDTVWITLRPTSDGRPVLVLNGKGDPIATVLVPNNSRLRQASATQLWMTERDEDGLVSVVRYRVSGINCGAGGC